MGSSHGKSSTIRDKSVEGTAYSDAVETFMTGEGRNPSHQEAETESKTQQRSTKRQRR